MPAAAKTITPLTIKPPNLKYGTYTIKGTAPLLVNCWSDKARQEMRDKQFGTKKAGPRAHKNPEECYQNSMYKSVTEEGATGILAVGVRLCLIRACTSVDGLTMVAARQMFRIIANLDHNLIKINGEHQMQEDMVRVGNGKADLRYRACYPDWSMDITVQYNQDLITAQQLLDLFVLAGFSVGLCEWRPEKNGQHGTFEVVTDTERDVA